MLAWRHYGTEHVHRSFSYQFLYAINHRQRGTHRGTVVLASSPGPFQFREVIAVPLVHDPAMRTTRRGSDGSLYVGFSHWQREASLFHGLYWCPINFSRSPGCKEILQEAQSYHQFMLIPPLPCNVHMNTEHEMSLHTALHTGSSVGVAWQHMVWWHSISRGENYLYCLW